MKKVIALIFIALFLFPLSGHAAVAPVTAQAVAAQSPVVDPLDLNNPALQGQSLAAKKKVVEAGLRDILSRLNDLSGQTQLAISQVNSNGVATDKPQASLIAANALLNKAKTDIDTFSAIVVPAKNNPQTLTALKAAALTAENSLGDAKAKLIDSLTGLKSLLPTVPTVNY